MKIVSVNVSEIREVDDDGKVVRTGIFKRPVAGRVRVGSLNLDGDDQADRKNHGGEHKAVYAFGQQHLPHWREALATLREEARAEGSGGGPVQASSAAAASGSGSGSGAGLGQGPGVGAFGPGFFGENLSVDTLDESELRVGDRLRAGSVLLEITQPRVPCFKLGLRAGVRRLPRAFVRHGRTGAYLRVLETGEFGAGDELVLESRGTMPHSLAELFAAVHDLGGPGRIEVLDAALGETALSDEWRALVEGKRRRLQGA